MCLSLLPSAATIWHFLSPKATNSSFLLHQVSQSETTARFDSVRNAHATRVIWSMGGPPPLQVETRRARSKGFGRYNK